MNNPIPGLTMENTEQTGENDDKWNNKYNNKSFIFKHQYKYELNSKYNK